MIKPAIHAVHHFRHNGDPAPVVRDALDPVVTHFGAGSIQTPADILTLIIRTDARFATRDLRSVFKAGGVECAVHPGAVISHEHFTDLVRTAYKAWGEAIIHALAINLNYREKYNLPSPENHGAHVHLHSANRLAGSVIRKACELLETEYADRPNALFISLDDMIHGHVFRQYASCGEFREVGFSRLFSHAGKEVGFVGRPGRSSIEAQIKEVGNTLRHMRGDSPHKIPVILLEDNVRRAKTLKWVFDEMEKGGVFKDGELAGIATCFSVATPDERANICHQGRKIPLLVGVDYADSRVDVVTPRDHFFDGFVVRHQDGGHGRLPSFMLPSEGIAENFKIRAERVAAFTRQIIDANLDFCAAVKEAVGITPPLQWFTPGRTIAEIAKLPLQTPMADVLNHVKQYGAPKHLQAVPT